MRRLMFLIPVLTFLLGGLAVDQTLAAEGEALFTSLGCGVCHKPDKKTAGAPLPELAKAYKDSGELVQFFKGEKPPVMTKETPPGMKTPMTKIKALSPADMQALADYIMKSK